MEHRKGVDNTNTDCLSRYPLPSDADAPLMDRSEGEIMPTATFLAIMGGVTTATPALEEERDIWKDEAVLRFIQTHEYGSGLSAKERDRIYRRAKAYRWMGSSIFKQLPGGRIVVVPKEAKREGLVLETHWGMGHYGVQRLLDRLQHNYWWRGIGDTVVRIIRACLSCARVKAGFKESGKEL